MQATKTGNKQLWGLQGVIIPPLDKTNPEMVEAPTLCVVVEQVQICSGDCLLREISFPSVINRALYSAGKAEAHLLAYVGHETCQTKEWVGWLFA